MAFRVGQKVVCVSPRQHAVDTNGIVQMSKAHPVKGDVVTVSEINTVDAGEVIGALRFLDDRLFLSFSEYTPFDWYDAGDFRPVKTTSIEIFRQMLAPKEVEPA